MLRTVWTNYITSGGAAEPECALLFKFINTFSLVGVGSLLIFSVVHFLAGNLFYGCVELTVGVAGMLNVILLRSTHNANLASTVILLAMLTVFLFLLATGGLYGTGLLWLFTFPALAFFMKGSRRGAWWMAAAFGEIAAMGLADYAYFLYTPYSSEVLRQLAASLLAVTLLVYFYQSIHENEDNLLRKRTQELIEMGWKRRSALERRLKL